MAHPSSGSSNGGFPPPRSSWPSGSGQTAQQQQLPPNFPLQNDDPTSLFPLYPIGFYAPTARVADHFASHTETLQPLSSATDLYPQYAAAFQTLNAPQNASDTQMRADMARRLAQSLNSPGFTSYADLSYATPAAAVEQVHRYSPSWTQPQHPSPHQQQHQQPPPYLSQQQQQSPSVASSSFNYSYPQQQLPQQTQTQHLSPPLPRQKIQPQQAQQVSATQYSANLTSQNLPPAFQQQSSSLPSQYQALAGSSSLASTIPYQQPSPSLPIQTVQGQYRQGSQSQSPQIQQYRQATQSQSPQVQYLSPPVQHRQPSPAQLQSSGYRQASPLQLQTNSYQLPAAQSQPSPVQYGLDLPSSGQYQASSSSTPVSFAAQANAVTAQPFPGQLQIPQAQPVDSSHTSPLLSQPQPFPSPSHSFSSQQLPSAPLPPAHQYTQPSPQQHFSHQQQQPQQQPPPPLLFPSQQQYTDPSTQYPQPTQHHSQTSSAPLPPPKPASIPQLSVMRPADSMPFQQEHQALPPPSPQTPVSKQKNTKPKEIPSTQALPYALLPPNPQYLSQPPPSPMSLTGDPNPSFANAYFENYIDHTLESHEPMAVNGSQTRTGGLQTTPAAPPTPAPTTTAAPIAPAAPTPTAPQPTTAPQLTPAPKPTPTPKPKAKAQLAPFPAPSAPPNVPHGSVPHSRPSPAPSALATPRKPKASQNAVGPSASQASQPSPAKKRKANPTLAQSASAPVPVSVSTPKKLPVIQVEVNKLTPEQRTTYSSFLTEPQRSTMSMRSTPTPRGNDEESDEELDWGDGARADVDGDWDMEQDPRFLGRDPIDSISVTPTSGQTGYKDQRTAFQKLQTLLEDIFEESDSFTGNPTIEEISASRFFDRLTLDGTHPLLADSTIDKLLRYVGRLQDNRKRQHSKSTVEKVPWDVDALLRLFRMLDRTMRDAESANPFPDNGRKAVSQTGPSPKKKKGTKRPSEDAAEQTPELEVSSSEIETGDEALAVMKAAAAAALCCLAILDGNGMPKQLYSEDLMSLAVSVIRDQMTKVIFPVVEGLAGEKLSSNYLAHVVSSEASVIAAKSKSSKKRSLFDNANLASLTQSTCAAVPHIAKLIARSDFSFSEDLVIRTVYLAVGPLFVREPVVRRGRVKSDGAGGPTWSVMKCLRTDALACLRGAFAKYEEQRKWIIEEILGSLGKNQEQGSQSTFQLPDGRSISTLTALLLQLIQASSHGVGSRIRRLRSKRIDMEGLEPGMQAVDQEALAQEENQLLTEANNTALRSTQVIAVFLIQKTSGNKSSKSQHDTDFKSILDNIVNDLLQVLYRPEWPAAAHFVALLSKILMSNLDESRSTAEANASKNVALDYLGDIAARLRTLQLDMDSQPIVPSLDELISKPNIEGLSKLLESQMSVQGFLTAAARDDSMYRSSGEMTRVIWAQELQAAVAKATSVLERSAQETEVAEVQEREQLKAITKSIRKVSRDVWSTTGGLFDVSAPKRAEDAALASYAIARARPLQKAFDPILRSLILAMDLQGVAMRSKALRGLAGIVVADPNILSQNEVRNAIEDRLSDSSPQVRDAAVDLIGKYVVQRAEWADQYFPLIAARISDQGLSVRKRVVKLLRDMCASNGSPETRVKICVTLVQAVQDEDDGIKDLALKSLSDIMYPAAFVPDETATLLVDILEQFRGSDAQLETALEGISKLCIEAGHKDRFAKTIDSLINRMIDATEENSFDAKSYIRAIFLLSLDSPALIDTSKASVLLTYLRQPPTTNAEIASNELLLQIFTRSIPFLPKAASTFANDLSNIVRSMIGKPISADFLPYPVACYTAVVKHITGEYYKMLQLLRTVVDKLPHAGEKQAPVLHYIAALFAEHGNLEVAVQKDKVQQDILNKMTKGQPMAEFLFDRFLTFSSKQHKSQTTPIRCMAALFRANPQLILKPKTEEWISSIAKSEYLDNKASLLDLLRDFLKSEAKRRGMGSSSKDVADLIGSANELHESGISTAVVQRHIEFIMDSAKSHHQGLQTAAMDVLEFTINQGLYHPLHLVALLISLETNPDGRMARSALSLHATLHSKHASMLNCRYLEFARSSYDYQRTLTSEVNGHRNGQALLGGWWEMLSEKRSVRIEFLKNIVRGFDFELLGQEEINPGFALYLAENLAVLDYHHQEEVMLVIQHLSRLISERGAGVANAIELGLVDGAEHEALEGKVAVVSEGERFSAIRVANASIIVALVLLTKNLLLDVYNLTEDKCLNFVSGKKSVVGERAVTRRYPDPVPLDYSRIPLPRGVEIVDDYNAQRDTFLQLMKEDNSIGWSM